MKTISITVKGRVQGVFFRQSSREKARELGITGEVRNLSNGDVELIATGEEETLITLTDWCKKGPPKAVVSSVEVRDLPLQEFDEFNIIRSH